MIFRTGCSRPEGPGTLESSWSNSVVLSCANAGAAVPKNKTAPATKPFAHSRETREHTRKIRTVLLLNISESSEIFLCVFCAVKQVGNARFACWFDGGAQVLVRPSGSRR